MSRMDNGPRFYLWQHIVTQVSPSTALETPEYIWGDPNISNTIRVEQH